MKVSVLIDSYKHQGESQSFFENIKFELDNNGFYLITGKSGIGKSTLMKIILGIHEGKMLGKITFDDGLICLSSTDLRARGLIGYQSSQSTMIPWKTIKANMNLPNKLNSSLPKLSDSSILNEMKQIGLESNIYNKYPHHLSTGMKARLGLIRACLYESKIIFLDELLSGVDTPTNLQILNYLVDKSKRRLIVAISHQIDRVVTISKMALIIRKDRTIITLNTPREDQIIDQMT